MKKPTQTLNPSLARTAIRSLPRKKVNIKVNHQDAPNATRNSEAIQQTDLCVSFIKQVIVNMVPKAKTKRVSVTKDIQNPAKKRAVVNVKTRNVI